MKIKARGIPAGSELNRLFNRFYYWDSFEIHLSRPELSVTEIYLGIFAHHPWWANALLALRLKTGAIFGLNGSTLAQLYNVEIKKNYAVGEKIARFTLFAQDEREIITGDDDKHLDFRVSVLKLNEAGENKVVMSTVVNPRNWFGKAYLFFILPFHRLGIRTILSNAVAARRV
jgi:hypothetical protein